jgi:two-component system, NarL family, sensor kinase
MPPTALPDSADNVMTPASTGAQHEEATPEKTPRAKKLAESPRRVSGARRNDGRLHIRPVSDHTASTIIRIPPAVYSTRWYCAMAADSRLIPKVIGTSTAAREATEQPGDTEGPGYVEVYVPFKQPGAPTLAFEAYYDYARVDQLSDSLFWYLIPLVLVPLVVLQLIQVPIAGSLAGRVRRHEEERADLLERSLMASDRERIRIASDLHDGPIQDLAGIGYALDAVEPSVPDRHRTLMRTVQTTVRHAIDSLRRLMVDVYPPDLDAGELPGAIADLAVPLRDNGVEVALDLDPMPDMDNEAVTTLYRVAREALANVAAHAQAGRVQICLRVDEDDTADLSGTVRLTIVDDGVGLDPDRTDRRDEGHLGLRLLKDRVENLGGTWRVAPGPSGGTRVTATLPLGPASS